MYSFFNKYEHRVELFAKNVHEIPNFVVGILSILLSVHSFESEILTQVSLPMSLDLVFSPFVL